jgi:hypothetical protein
MIKADEVSYRREFNDFGYLEGFENRVGIIHVKGTILYSNSNPFSRKNINKNFTKVIAFEIPDDFYDGNKLDRNTIIDEKIEETIKTEHELPGNPIINNSGLSYDDFQFHGDKKPDPDNILDVNYRLNLDSTGIAFAGYVKLKNNGHRPGFSGFVDFLPGEGMNLPRSKSLKKALVDLSKYLGVDVEEIKQMSRCNNN